MSTPGISGPQAHATADVSRPEGRRRRARARALDAATFHLSPEGQGERGVGGLVRGAADTRRVRLLCRCKEAA
jgi:hypothetical protein